MEDIVVEAVNAMSLESYEGCFEDLAERGILAAAQLRLVENLDLRSKAISYALAILSCARATPEARDFATDLLHRFM